MSILTSPIIETEINIIHAPEELQTVVSEKLDKDCKLLSFIRKTSYPYKDKDRESVSYKAYMLWGNLMVLLTKYEWTSQVEENSMIAGDIIKMSEYWNNQFK